MELHHSQSVKILLFKQINPLSHNSEGDMAKVNIPNGDAVAAVLIQSINMTALMSGRKWRKTQPREKRCLICRNKIYIRSKGMHRVHGFHRKNQVMGL